MIERAWRLHVKDILSGIQKSLVLLLLENTSNRPQERSRFLANGSFKNINSTSKLNLVLIQELKDLVNGIDLKGSTMAFKDIFDQAKDLDSMISTLTNFVKNHEHYEDMYAGILEDDKGDANTQQRLKKARILEAASGREWDLLKLGLVLYEASMFDDIGLVEFFVENGYPINFQDPISLRTSLHRASAYSADKVAQYLINNEKCDLLLRSRSNSLAFDVMYEQGTNVALCYTLGGATIKQAETQGLDTSTLFEKAQVERYKIQNQHFSLDNE